MGFFGSSGGGFLPQKEAITSIRGELLPSTEGSTCLLPRKEAIASFGGRIQSPKSADGSNCFLRQKEAIASIRGKMQLLPSAEGSNCFPLLKEASASFHANNWFLLRRETIGSPCRTKKFAGPMAQGVSDLAWHGNGKSE